MIRIMVDSSSDCGRDNANFDYFVPMTLNIGGSEYRDGIELDADRFYELLLQSEAFPKTSQPALEEFVRYFEQAKQAGDEVIYFALSSALSGTYQSACIAKSMVDYDGIYIVDTLTATAMISVLADYAAGLIKDGLAAGQIVQKCEELKSKVKVLAGLDTLEYLYRGGRVSRVSAAVGEIAGIKPIITVTEDGRVNAGSKAIGVPRAMQTILTKLKSYDLDDRFPIYGLYTCGTENLTKLETKLDAAGYPVRQRRQVGPTIGAHIGPNAYGVLFVTK